jgi:hypothetical protein
LLPDDQVHPDTHVLTMVNNVIGVVNYVIAARPSLLNFVIADTDLPGKTPAWPASAAVGKGTIGRLAGLETTQCGAAARLLSLVAK